MKAYVIFRNGEVYTSQKGKVIHHHKRHAQITVGNARNEYEYRHKEKLTDEFTIKTYEMIECK